LDATVNPDFGQVELDPATINLSAFETSFDEKRPFFVEGSSVFGFCTRLFYSRRIARPPQGSMPHDVTISDRPEASTILAAGKVTGRAGDWNVGLLEAVTAEEHARYVTEDGDEGRATVEPLTNYVVGRAERLMHDGRTQIGAIATAVHRRLGDEDHLRATLRSAAWTGGVDFSHEFFDRAWSLSGYFAFSHIAGAE